MMAESENKSPTTRNDEICTLRNLQSHLLQCQWSARRQKKERKLSQNPNQITCLHFHFSQKQKHIAKSKNNSFKQSFSGHLILRFHQLTKFFFKILSLRSTWARNLGWLVWLMVKLPNTNQLRINSYDY